MSVVENMLKVVVVLAIVACAHAAEMLAPLEQKPDKFENEQGCYIEELDAVIPFGQSWPSKQCLEYTCGQDFVTITTCGVAIVYPPCTLISDKTKPYPGCCPTPQCP